MIWKALFLVNGLLLLSSCASTGQKTECGATRIVSTIDKAHRYVDRGKYRMALDLYSKIYRRCQDRALAGEYRTNGERLRKAADQEYDRKDYTRAGGIYYNLLQSTITTDIPGLLTFDGVYLRNRINACSQTLAECGLKKYREENLDEAIEIWQSILAFDPGNQAVAKAAQTAIRQREQFNIFE